MVIIMVLKAEHIFHTFIQGGIVRECLSDVNLTIMPGEFKCLTGESGTGKTTLLNILTGMLKPTQGAVYLDEKNIYDDMNESQRTECRNSSIGYLMQGMALLGNLTVYENLIFPLELAGRTYDQARVLKVLQELELGSVQDSYPQVLSGGEYRRASLARTILLEPEILVADEPTSNLDERSAGIVRRMLTDYCQSGKSVLVATHDRKLVQ